MATEKIRHLVTKKNRDGSPRHYWQPSKGLAELGWPTRRLSDVRGAAIAEAEAINENLDAWRAGASVPAGRPGPTPAGANMPPGGKPATVAQLIAAFKRHRYYTDLKPKTRRWYDDNLKTVEAWAGDKPVLAIDRALVDALYRSMRVATPAKAAAVVGAIRRIYEYGKIPFGEQFPNPAARLNVSHKRATAPRLWPHEAEAAYIAAADALGRPSVGDMVAYGAWLGHYPADLTALRRPNYGDGCMVFHRSKTGARIAVPLSPVVVARIEAALARQAAAHVVSDYLVLNEATMRPYADAADFGKAFREVRARVAAAHPEAPEWAGLWFMWLRHTAVVRLVEAGCSDKQIAAITGHSLRSVKNILDEHYFQPTDELAEQAIGKRLKFEADKPVKLR